MKVKLEVIHNVVYLPVPLQVLRHLRWSNGDEVVLDVPNDGQTLVAHAPNSTVTHFTGVREVTGGSR